MAKYVLIFFSFIFAWHRIFIEGKSLGNQVATTIDCSDRNNNKETMANYEFTSLKF